MKNKEVVEKILAYHPKLQHDSGWDDYKCGDPEAECTGVATALVPTVDVIRRASALGCSLIMAHEPIFFQSPDYPQWRGDFPNQVYEDKMKLIRETGITVWRNHDHMHAHEPDSIFTGVMRYIEWEDYFKPEISDLGHAAYVFDLPETAVGTIGTHLKEKLGLNGLRYMGRKEDKISRVAMVAHLYPNSFMMDGEDENGYYHDYAMEIIQLMEEQGVQAIIPGEIIEWTVLAHIRDGIAQGKPLACFNIGHYHLEELGMKYAADWIRELVDQQVPVHYVPTGDDFHYM